MYPSVDDNVLSPGAAVILTECPSLICTFAEPRSTVPANKEIFGGNAVLSSVASKEELPRLRRLSGRDSMFAPERCTACKNMPAPAVSRVSFSKRIAPALPSSRSFGSKSQVLLIRSRLSFVASSILFADTLMRLPAMIVKMPSSCSFPLPICILVSSKSTLPAAATTEGACTVLPSVASPDWM